MKTTSIALAGLLSLIGAAAFAQTNPVVQVQQDNAQIHQDNKAVRQDNREVHHDNKVIAVKKGEIAGGKQQLQADRSARDATARAEQHDIRKGDLADAQKLDQARRAEQHDVKVEKHAIAKDQAVVAHHAADKQQTLVARHDEKVVRHVDVVKRNQDAAKI